MALRATKQTKPTTDYRSVKNLPQRKHPVQVITNTKQPQKLLFCQCVCKRCGHRKHERQEQLLKSKLEVGSTVQPVINTKPVRNLKSSQSQDLQETRHVQQQPRTEVKVAKNACCNNGCCCYTSYKCCPNTSMYQEMEANQMKKQQSQLIRQQANRNQDTRQERPYITVEDYDRQGEAELNNGHKTNIKQPEETQVTKGHHDNKQRLDFTSPPHNRDIHTDDIANYQYMQSQRDKWFNHHKQSQFDHLNQRVGLGYHAVRKQLQLASDVFDFTHDVEYRQDSYHCPSRLPNHRDYQWENKVVPSRYYCKCPGDCNCQHPSQNRQQISDQPHKYASTKEAKQYPNVVNSPTHAPDNRVQFKVTNKSNLHK